MNDSTATSTPEPMPDERLARERTMRDALMAAGMAAADEWLATRANRRMSEVNRRWLVGHVVNALWEPIVDSALGIAHLVSGDVEAAYEQALSGLEAQRTRAETAERELAEMRGRIGDATVEWAVHWRSMRDHYEICDTEEEAREAFDPDDPTYGVRSRIVGEWKVVDDGR